MSHSKQNLPSTQTSQISLIKQEIQKLHDKGSGDWQSLNKQVLNNFRPIRYNPLQLTMELAADMCQELVVEAGRGAGKSTGIGARMRRVARELPRSNNILIGSTYQQILTRTLPSTIYSLEMQGLFQGLHFFVGRRPPASWKWPQPYQPPSKYDKCIYFYTGAVYNMISQDVTGDGRGLNADTAIADEAALLSKDKLDSDTRPTIRGSNLRRFQGHPLFLSELYCSTTPLTQEGKWFVDKEEEAFRSRQVKFLKATCVVNQHNLPADYLEKAKRGSIPWIYHAEYLNVRPRFVKDGFYNLLDEDLHCYNDFDYTFYQHPGQESDCRGDSDLVPGLPLVLGVDWGAAINCMTISQHLVSDKEFRVLKSMYVLGDNQEIQDDLLRKFHYYYQYHDQKTIYLHYDATGNLRTGNTRSTRAEQARQLLTNLGWHVQLMTNYNTNPQHELKYMLWQRILREDDHRVPRFRMNRSNCRDLFVSMRNAQTRQGRNGEVKKDKSSEGSKKIDRQHATDLSDAMDQPIFNLFRQFLHGNTEQLPQVRVKSQ